MKQEEPWDEGSTDPITEERVRKVEPEETPKRKETGITTILQGEDLNDEYNTIIRYVKGTGMKRYEPD